MADFSFSHNNNTPKSVPFFPLLFNPDNPVHESNFTSFEPPLEPEIESETCEFDLDLEFDMDPKFEPFGCDYLDEDDDGHDDDEDDDGDQVRFVTNLFHNLEPREGTVGGSGSDELDLELGLGLGSSQSTEQTRRFEGLRVVSVDSDSDSEDELLRDFDEGVNGDGFDGVTDFDRPPFCWDYLGFNSRRDNNRDDAALEEVINNCWQDQELPTIASEDDDDGGSFFFGGRHDVYEDDNDDGEVPILLDDDEMEREREDREVSILFDTYQERAEQEIMIQSDSDEGGEFDVEEAIRDLEWEILLAVNNFNREVYDMDVNVDVYEAMLSEVVEHANEWRGSPPAAESVIENLPNVRLSSVSMEENHVCAICKDDISGEETVRQLPCSHYYHGDCIVPWLKMRNTCPVCRHELPTDDLEYEHSRRGDEGLTADVDVPQVEYDFHVFL